MTETRKLTRRRKTRKRARIVTREIVQERLIVPWNRGRRPRSRGCFCNSRANPSRDYFFLDFTGPNRTSKPARGRAPLLNYCALGCSLRSPQLVKRHLQRESLFATIDRYSHSITGVMIVQYVLDVLRRLDVLVIDLDDEISADIDRRIPEIGPFTTATYAGSISSAAGNYLLNEHAGIGSESHLVGQLGANWEQSGDSQTGTTDSPELYQVIEHGFC